MAEKVLLLGHEKDAGLALARTLVELGYHPIAAGWGDFSPRSYGRDRPRCLLADTGTPGATPVELLCAEVRRRWGDSYPILVVSASEKFRDTSALLDAGASDCLPRRPPSALLGRKLQRYLQTAIASQAEADDELPESLLDIFTRNRRLVRLGDLVSVHPGAVPRRASFRRLAPPDSEWRGVLTSEAVERFYVGKPDSYLRWTRLHLFRMPPPEEYSVPEKVLLRRAGPPLAAAVDRSRLPAGTDVYSLVPAEGVGAGFVACLLNSRLLDFYFNRMAGVGRDGRLRPEDIREVPVPRPTAAAAQELGRAATLLAHFGANPQSWIDRQSKDEVWETMENTVFELYGADRLARSELAALHF